MDIGEVLIFVIWSWCFDISCSASSWCEIEDDLLTPNFCEDARDVMVRVVGNGYSDPSWKHERDWLDLTLGNRKNMNLTILPTAMGKYKGRMGSLALAW